MALVAQVKPGKKHVYPVSADTIEVAPDETNGGMVASMIRVVCLAYLAVSMIGAVPAVVPLSLQNQPPALSTQERVAVLEANAGTVALDIQNNQDAIRDIATALNDLSIAHTETMRSVDTIMSYARMGVQILAAIALTVFVEVTRRLFNLAWPWPSKRSKK